MARPKKKRTKTVQGQTLQIASKFAGSDGCARIVYPKRVKHRGGGSHLAYFARKDNPTCGRKKSA